MRVHIKVVSPVATIERDILKAIADQFYKIYQKKRPALVRQIKELVIKHYQSTETYKALVDGILAGHFGFPVGEEKPIVDTVLHAIADNIRISFKKITVRKTALDGGISIDILRSDLKDAFSASTSVLIVDTYVLPWLDWLLIEGDRVVIADYDFNPSDYGRSEKGTMVKRNVGWRVPPQFSGTLQYNWLTNAISADNDSFVNKIRDVIYREMFK